MEFLSPRSQPLDQLRMTKVDSVEVPDAEGPRAKVRRKLAQVRVQLHLRLTRPCRHPRNHASYVAGLESRVDIHDRHVGGTAIKHTQ